MNARMLVSAKLTLCTHTVQDPCLGNSAVSSCISWLNHQSIPYWQEHRPTWSRHCILHVHFMSKVIPQCVILTIKTHYPSEDERKNPEGENKKVERTQHRSEVSWVNCTLGVPAFGLVSYYNVAENETQRNKQRIEALLPETSANEDFLISWPSCLRCSNQISKK